jgi:DNA-binding transcriptional ArsR family regulator
MAEDVDIALVGALIGDRARAVMLQALLGGDRISAGQLARSAGVSKSGATAHLRRLRDGGLVSAETIGRHRLYRLANPEVADVLEALARVAPLRPVRSLRQSESVDALRAARTCYDHLAGELGVGITEALVAREYLLSSPESFAITSDGASFFSHLGIDVYELAQRRRSLARTCLDWSERKHHVAGSLGAAVADVFFQRKWIRRLPGGRAVVLQTAGRQWLERELGFARRGMNEG